MKLSCLLLLVLLFGACSNTRWTHVHPNYRPPMGVQTIAVVPLDDAFMLTRPEWFADQLNIAPDSVHALLSRLSDSLLLQGLREEWPAMEMAPAGTRESFVAETQKLDETIYLKVRYPYQGQVVFLASGAAPDYLLLMHEYTLGVDLRKELFYDYRLANQETTAGKSIQKLSLLLSFTLWDNQRQVPLYSGISEVHQPLEAGQLNDSLFADATRQLALRCMRQLKEKR